MDEKNIIMKVDWAVLFAKAIVLLGVTFVYVTPLFLVFYLNILIFSQLFIFWYFFIFYGIYLFFLKAAPIAKWGRGFPSQTKTH